MIRLKVKEIAQSRGISQNRLARKADIDNKTLRNIYQNPHQTITTETLDKLAQALNIDASQLLESDPPLPKA